MLHSNVKYEKVPRCWIAGVHWIELLYHRWTATSTGVIRSYRLTLLTNYTQNWVMISTIVSTSIYCVR